MYHPPSYNIGSKKGRAPVDHLVLLKELQVKSKKEGKDLYLTFLDVEKAYDKAWNKAILYVLNKIGLKSKIWTIVKS